MATKIDLKGRRFGRLVVIREDTTNSYKGRLKWVCKCDCNENVSVAGGSLRRGLTKSCGCLRKEKATTHGLVKDPLYRTYIDMKNRCHNIKATNYSYYGGRSIKVCERWLNNPINFIEDMRDGYELGLQLDRIDNRKGYCKNNCRWVTHKQNMSNKGPNNISSSCYKGVGWSKRDNKWRARVKLNGKTIHLGYFTHEEEAALVYNKKAKELFGEYAYLNKID